MNRMQLRAPKALHRRSVRARRVSVAHEVPARVLGRAPRPALGRRCALGCVAASGGLDGLQKRPTASSATTDAARIPVPGGARMTTLPNDAAATLVLEQHANGATYVTETAFLYHATRAVASRYTAPGVHHRDIKARAVLNARIERAMQDRGHELTTRERAELADEVRLSFPPGRRPTLGYDTRSVRHVSLDAPVGDGTATLGELLDQGVFA